MTYTLKSVLEVVKTTLARNEQDVVFEPEELEIIRDALIELEDIKLQNLADNTYREYLRGKD